MGKHSRRLTRIAQALKAANPFEKVLPTHLICKHE